MRMLRQDPISCFPAQPYTAFGALLSSTGREKFTFGLLEKEYIHYKYTLSRFFKPEKC